MKKLFRYFKLDMVSVIFLAVTIGLLVYHFVGNADVSPFLALVALFIFRGIMWQGQYVDRIRQQEKIIEELEMEKKVLLSH